MPVPRRPPGAVWAEAATVPDRRRARTRTVLRTIPSHRIVWSETSARETWTPRSGPFHFITGAGLRGGKGQRRQTSPPACRNARKKMKKRPLVLVTRRLPDIVETRMRELFETRLNLEDRPMTPAELVEAVKTVDV